MCDLCLATFAFLTAVLQLHATADMEEIERISKSGETLGREISEQFPLPEQHVRNDTGINVLIDLSHQALFFTMWTLPRELRNMGFRACGSQASLDTVLEPGRLSRVRIPVGDRRPFAWVPNPEFNLVITTQTHHRYQDFTSEEMSALDRFIGSGGGLIAIGGGIFEEEHIREWPLNRLISRYGAAFSAKSDTYQGTRTPTLDLNDDWDVWVRGDGELPIVAATSHGSGRLIVIASLSLISWGGQTPDELKDSRLSLIERAVRWASSGKSPVGGSLRLPTEAAGGGPIYPELVQKVGNVNVYYAKNQKEELLRTIREDMPRIKELIESWLPSKPLGERMHLILSSGDGGGWAVNAYQPKEVGIISLDSLGVLSVFAHELAHTMAGPPNAKGEIAGYAPHGNQGEEHAGWFQTKAIVAITGGREGRDPNHLFDFDPTGTELDLADDSAESRRKWSKDKYWTKLWWVWQKLDDRYGTTWYPRWRWVQHTRWQDDPEHRLTWDEMVEDMSIAVGEDLFPFFRKIGTSLSKERYPTATFMGQQIDLPIAPLEITRCGPTRLDPIGDYTKPIFIRDNAIAIDDRLELFIDDYLIEEMSGGAHLQLHKPAIREVSLVHDAPWEGNTCGYFTIIEDGGKYRMYYRGWHSKDGKPTHECFTCLAESDDGIHWRKPELGLFEFDGSKANNIVWKGIGTHNFTPFIDTNPNADPGQRYKAVGGIKSEGGLFGFYSPDGIHWQMISDKPIITDGAFDSQNLVFWDVVRGEYRAYFRDSRDGFRDIKTCTSPDFLNWSDPVWLDYGDAPKEHLYTNQIQPYARAPHIFIGFPTRYMPNRESIVEGLLMSSRDGRTFKRWEEAIIRPGRNRDRWHNRSNYIWLGIVETESDLPGGGRELSIYTNERYYKGQGVKTRRYTYRIDGFVSVNAPYSGGTLLTKPILFRGSRLVLNCSTSAAGTIRVEIQSPDGKPIDGYKLDECQEIYGDEIEQVVRWNGNEDVSSLQDTPVRLLFTLSDADIYSFRFVR